ncbi:MAG: hypothetical protein FJX57_25770 [Alphaproteobacteria bacterium]|nr:hypothetical protein [Alphaproteobacteria bacterium]
MIKIHRLRSDASGKTFFEDVNADYVRQTGAGRMSVQFPATGFVFRQVVLPYDCDWHPAPRRQLVVNLDNGVQITAGTGESRIIGQGEILWVEDVTGQGHLSKAINERLRHTIDVTLD